MPNRDATGPLGYGSATGRGLGPCGMGLKRGLGRGYGQGLGFRRFYTKKEESDILKEEGEALEGELKAVKERLDELALKKAK